MSNCKYVKLSICLSVHLKHFLQMFLSTLFLPIFFWSLGIFMVSEGVKVSQDLTGFTLPPTQEQSSLNGFISQFNSQSVNLSNCQSVKLSICLAVNLSIFQAVNLSICQSVKLSNCQSVNPSICQSVNVN